MQPQAQKQFFRFYAGNIQTLSATELAKAAGNPVAANLVMTGALAGAGIAPIPMVTFLSVTKMLFSGDSLQLNLKAFELGYKAV